MLIATPSNMGAIDRCEDFLMVIRNIKNDCMDQFGRYESDDRVSRRGKWSKIEPFKLWVCVALLMAVNCWRRSSAIRLDVVDCNELQGGGVAQSHLSLLILST